MKPDEIYGKSLMFVNSTGGMIHHGQAQGRLKQAHWANHITMLSQFIGWSLIITGIRETMLSGNWRNTAEWPAWKRYLHYWNTPGLSHYTSILPLDMLISWNIITIKYYSMVHKTPNFIHTHTHRQTHTDTDRHTDTHTHTLRIPPKCN